MKNIFVFLLALAVTLLIQTCKDKDEIARLNMTQLWECNASQNFDSTKLAEKLIGSWKWIKFQCESTELVAADKEVIVSFMSNGQFTVRENGTMTTQGHWSLKIVDNPIYGLKLDTPSIYLYGRILLCDNQVLFNAGYMDICDYLFERIV